MFGSHLLDSRKLMEIERYPNKTTLCRKKTVAEHCWFVAKTAHGLALWERDKFKVNKVNMEKVSFIADNHDLVEAITGDIISTTKNFSPAFKEELLKIEKMIFEEHIIKTLPQSWGQMYLDMNEELAEMMTVEAKIVKAADIIDGIYESMDEVRFGNTDEFEEILVGNIEKLMTLDLMCAEYFLKYSIKDIKGAYDYVPADIKEYLENKDFSEYF